MQVAVLGLGIIGGGIAQNLLGAGYNVTVYNRSPEKARPFGDQGARVATTPREATAGAEVVIAAVGNDEASEAIWVGPDGALEGASTSATLVECSTLSTDWVARLAETASERSLAFLDSPVLGSKDQSEAGQLRLLVGGERAALERVRPVLEAFTAEINYLGPSGSGARMKLINNSMVATQIVGLAEGLVLAERAGLDVEQVATLLANGAPGSPAVKGRAQRMVARDYEDVHFALRWMRKDTGYGVAEGERFGLEMATVVAARDALQRAIDQGYGDLDFGAVVEALRKR